MSPRKKFSMLMGAKRRPEASKGTQGKEVVVVPVGMSHRAQATVRPVVIAKKRIQILVSCNLISPMEGVKMAKIVQAHPLLLKKGLDDKDLVRLGISQDAVDKLLAHARMLGAKRTLTDGRPLRRPFGGRGKRPSRYGGGLFSGSLAVLMSVRPGGEIIHTGGRIFHGTGLGSFVSDNGGDCNVTHEKRKLRRKPNPNGGPGDPNNPNNLTLLGLYRQLAEDYYNRFVSCDLDKIKLKKNAFILEDDDLDEETGFSYETLNPAAFLMSLHVLHLALKDEWHKDGSDELRSIKLRNYILEHYPEHEQKMNEIEADVEKMDSETFITEHETTMSRPCPRTPSSDFKMYDDLQKYGFTPEFYGDKTRQFNLQDILVNNIHTMIAETSKRRERWYWGFVFEALKRAHVLYETKTVGVKTKPMSYGDFGEAMHVFLKGTKHEQTAKSIRTRCYDTPEIKKNKDYEWRIKQIMELLRMRDLYIAK